MKKEIKNSIQILSCAMLLAFFILLAKGVADAQSSSYTAMWIAGETGGVEDVCCNGVIVSFESIDSKNQYYLDGEAIIIPGVSKLYSAGNEMSEGYCTLGKVNQYGFCLTISSECESVEQYPQVVAVGTSAGTCSNSGNNENSSSDNSSNSNSNTTSLAIAGGVIGAVAIGSQMNGDDNSAAINNQNRPDITITEIKVGKIDNNKFIEDDRIGSDENATLVFTVKNEGSAFTGPWFFEIKNSPNENNYESEEQINLNPGESKEFTLRFENTKEGIYEIEVKIDSKNNMAEEDEENNIKSKELTVTD